MAVDLDHARRKAKAALDLRAAFEQHKDHAYGEMCKAALATWPQSLAELVNAMADEMEAARAVVGALESCRQRLHPETWDAMNKKAREEFLAQIALIHNTLAAYDEVVGTECKGRNTDDHD